MTTPVAPPKDLLDAGGRRIPDTQSQLPTNSDEVKVDTDTASSPSGPDILLKLEVPGGWSGKGQHVAFAQNEAIPLEEGQFLGRGTFADVHEVTCKRISIARKRIYCNRRMKIQEVSRELDVLKKLSHKHVVTLLGSYTQNKVLGLLLYPVAVCDLGVFLDELDENQSTHSADFEKLMDRLGFAGDVNHAKDRLNKVYGCLANAVQYLHENDIRHKDIKPRNILLDKNDGLYITDFGLSRDTADASSSITDGIERGTYKYCAPEVARLEPRGRAADVYSLGCVFLEINTVSCRLSLTALEEFRVNNEDRSYQNNPQKMREWMLKLRQISTNNSAGGFFNIVDIIEKMVSPVPSDRPDIGTICSSLYLLGNLVYFGKCCPIQQYQVLRNENAKLKQESAQLRRQHEVDHPAEINRLQMDHRSEMRGLQAGHDQKISDMTREHQDAEEALEQKRQNQLHKMKEMDKKYQAAVEYYELRIEDMVEKLEEAEHYYKEKLQDLEQKHAKAMDGIHGRHEIEKLAMAEAHKKEISTYETKMQSQTFKFHKKMDATLVRHEAEIHVIKYGHCSEVARLREDRRKFEEVQEKEHAKRLSAMTAQHDAEKTAIVRNIRAMEEQHGLEVARMKQARRDSERSHESEMSALKAAHEKQLFEVHSLLAKECYENELEDIPRSSDSFAVETEVEVKNEIPTAGRSQPPTRENGDQVVAAMENERSPAYYAMARMRRGDEEEVPPMLISNLTSPTSIEPPRAQDEASAALGKEKVMPVEGSILGYKGPGLLKSMMFQRKYFWFSRERIHRNLLGGYLRGEKDQRLAERTATLASLTGKGLLYFSKIPEVKTSNMRRIPTGIFNLSEVTELSPDGAVEFSFLYGGHKHLFQANTVSERDSWLGDLEAMIEEAKTSPLASEQLRSRAAKEEREERLSLTPRGQEHIARVTGQPVINMAQNNNRQALGGGLVGVIEAREKEKQQMKQGINSQAVQQAIAQRQQQA